MTKFIPLLVFTLLPIKTLADNIEWSSFGTLGLTLSDSDYYGFRRDVSIDDGVYSGDIDFKQLSLIGGQLETSISTHLDFVGQVVIKDMTDADWHDYVTLAFIRYNPSSNWSFRAGRLTPDLFTISEYRNVNVAYTWAMAPTEVYGMLPFQHFDGLDITYTQRVGQGTVALKAFGGISEVIATTATTVEQLDLEKMHGLSVTYDASSWNIQARYTGATLGETANSISGIKAFIAQIPDPLWPNKDSIYSQLHIDGKDAEYYSFSGQRYVNSWLFNFEVAQIDSDSDVFRKVNSGYVSMSYNMGAHSLFSVYAKTKADTYQFNEPGVPVQFFPELIANIEYAMNYYASNQQTLSVGWRWDMSPLVSAKLQYNYTQIDEGGGTLWFSENISQPKENVQSVLFTLSYAL